jgi:hypothetical protein
MGMASFGGGGGASNIDYGGGSAAAKQAKKAPSERRKSRKGRQSQAGADDGMPLLFGELTMVPLAQVFKDGGFKPPAEADIALVYTPVVLQHLLGGPVGPGGGACAGFNQPLLLELPFLLEPRSNSKWKIAWSGRR